MRNPGRLTLLSLALVLAVAHAAPGAEADPALKTRKPVTGRVASVSDGGRKAGVAVALDAEVRDNSYFLVRRKDQEDAWLKVTSIKQESDGKLCATELRAGPAVAVGDPAIKAFKLGKVILYPEQRSLEVKGRVCLQNGPLEFLAVLEGGKDYESVLAFDCKAGDLNFGMLAADYKAEGGVRKIGDPQTPKGDPVYLYVTWTDPEGQDHRVRAEELLYHQGTKKPMRESAWVFTGSGFEKDPGTGENVFQAEKYKVLIAVFRDPAAIFNCPLDTGAEDYYYSVNEKAVPKNIEWYCVDHPEPLLKADGICTVPCVLERVLNEKSGKWACPYHGGKKEEGGVCGEPCGRRLVAKGYPIKLILEPAPADALDPDKLKDGLDSVKPPEGENPPPG